MNWLNNKLGTELEIEGIDDHSFWILIEDGSNVLISPNKTFAKSELRFPNSDEVITLDYFISPFYYSKAIIIDIPSMGRSLIIESSNSNIKRNMSCIKSVSIILLSNVENRVFSFTSFMSGINGLKVNGDKLEVRVLECSGLDETREAFIVCLNQFVLSLNGLIRTEQSPKAYYYEVESGNLVECMYENCRKLDYPFVENPW